ncbi:MAG: HNH endonuclease signature motif containing protein [bacterium]|nr:HNH endonuclease signature motif containing protein [bacterium]
MRVYSGDRWRTLRRRVLDRDGWRCTRCGRAGRLEVDHRVALADGGHPFRLDNLAALCRGCHRGKTIEEKRVRRADPPEVVAWSEHLRRVEASRSGTVRQNS